MLSISQSIFWCLELNHLQNKTEEMMTKNVLDLCQKHQQFIISYNYSFNVFLLMWMTLGVIASYTMIWYFHIENYHLLSFASPMTWVIKMIQKMHWQRRNHGNMWWQHTYIHNYFMFEQPNPELVNQTLFFILNGIFFYGCIFSKQWKTQSLHVWMILPTTQNSISMMFGVVGSIVICMKIDIKSVSLTLVHHIMVNVLFFWINIRLTNVMEIPPITKCNYEWKNWIWERGLMGFVWSASFFLPFSIDFRFFTCLCCPSRICLSSWSQAFLGRWLHHYRND